jgi:hypothetical protein
MLSRPFQLITRGGETAWVHSALEPAGWAGATR